VVAETGEVVSVSVVRHGAAVTEGSRGKGARRGGSWWSRQGRAKKRGGRGRGSRRGAEGARGAESHGGSRGCGAQGHGRGVVRLRRCRVRGRGRGHGRGVVRLRRGRVRGRGVARSRLRRGAVVGAVRNPNRGSRWWQGREGCGI